MATSMNGWPASPTLPTRTVVIAGATFHMVDNDDAITVLTYVFTQYAETVEPLKPSRCACFSYRANVNNPSKLSNHSSATAGDLNWDDHPNNTPATKTFTPKQIAACHAILASIPELAEVVHWGGDWFPPLVPDPMHWELHDHDLAKLARVAARIREVDDVTEDDINKIAAKVVDLLTNGKPTGATLTRDQLWKQTNGAADEARDLLKRTTVSTDKKHK